MESEIRLREEHRAKQLQENQRRIVNVKTCSTNTMSIYNWTYRNTGCDVISIITTIVPQINGEMNDIKRYNKALTRIKGIGCKLNDKPYRNPLQQKGDTDGSLDRKRLHNILYAEKESFMARLSSARNSRTKTEQISAIIIQRNFRGYSTRRNMRNIVNNFQRQKNMRKRIRQLINSSSTGTQNEKAFMLMPLAEQRLTYTRRRLSCAIKIQCLFRCYISRKLFRNKRRDAELTRYQRAIICLQTWIRKVLAIRKALGMRERLIAAKKISSSVRIQAAYRSHFARRLVRYRRYQLRWVCARMIQTWFRAASSQRMVKALRDAWINRKKFLAARGFQRLIRGFIHRMRVDRIKHRRLFLIAFRSAVAIQSRARGMIARQLVAQLRKNPPTRPSPVHTQYIRDDYFIYPSTPLYSSSPDSLSLSEPTKRLSVGSLALLDEANIFVQARLGNTKTVGDIFSGLLTDEPQSTTDVDSNGDTVLTIAAASGHLDLLRKCLIWGYDINHRNIANENALILAIKAGNEDIVNYILNPPPFSDEEYKPETQTLHSISDADMGILFTAAAEFGHGSLIATLEAQGFDVNSKHPENGMIAVHLACLKDDAQILRQLCKMKGDSKAVDEIEQRPIHKACCTSLEITLLFLDLFVAPLAEGEVDEEKMRRRAAELTIRDGDGKDCLLIAALSGKSVILKQLRTMIRPQKKNEEETIGWAPVDINKVLSLVADGNLECLSYVLEEGFDPCWAQDETGVTVAMVAAICGQLSILDLLMEKDVPLDQEDVAGRTALHYATFSREASRILSQILLHPHAKACRVSEMSLTAQDKLGQSVLYTAVANGRRVRLDLIAAAGVQAALAVRDDNGLTPLMIAARYLHENELSYLLSLDTNINAVDNRGKNVLWHLFHRQDTKSPPYDFKLPVIEWTSGLPQSLHRIYHPPYVTEDDASISETELTLAKLLLQHGCNLYSTNLTPVTADSAPSPLESDDPVDLAAKSGYTAFFKMIPTVVSSSNCWLAALSCLRFEDSEGPCLSALLEGDGLSAMTMSLNNEARPGVQTDEMSQSEISVIASVSTARPASALKSSFSQLNGFFFRGLNIAGWAIRFKNNRALAMLLSRGISATTFADISMNYGLHLAARFGNIGAIDEICHCGRKILLEQANGRGYTAVMEGAVVGDMKVVKRLLHHGCDARKGLEGKYWAWLLAIVRQRERCQKNLQSTLFGDDDDIYFSTWPDPSYIVWYNGAM